MSDPVWYYARGESEKGPISTPQIKALAAAGGLRRDDLVWKEGMENWLPAAEVAELFPPDQRAKEPVFKSDSTTVKPDVAPPTQPQRARPAIPPELDARQILRRGGRALVILGVLVVLLSRGCDSLGVRRAARLKAIAGSAESEFQREWTREKTELEDERQLLSDKPNRSSTDQERGPAITAELEKLDQDKGAEQARLRRGTWRRQQDAAESAGSENIMWSYWRQLTFVFGTMVLTVGLLAVTPNTDGPERWLCLVMLGIVLYSIFSADSIWSGVF